MRTRLIGTAAIGALALSALAMPVAQADTFRPKDVSEGDTKITKVVVDGDNKVAFGTSGAKTVKVSVTATDDSGIKSAEEFSLVGPGTGFELTGKPTCTKVNSTTSTCSASVKIDPKTDYLLNANAGTWYVDAWVTAKDATTVGGEGRLLQVPACRQADHRRRSRAGQEGQDPHGDRQPHPGQLGVAEVRPTAASP
ncbi:hypothetical protein SFUMM280S_03668 [Streptomyces fumanus]